MRNRLFAILMLVSLIAVINPGISTTVSALDSPRYSLAQVANLQFTADMVLVTVEQGGSNTANIRVHNYGGDVGSANITFQGLEPDGITVELSTTSIIDLNGGTYQDIIATVSAEAGLWPLGPRRLDLGLMNGTTELDVHRDECSRSNHHYSFRSFGNSNRNNCAFSGCYRTRRVNSRGTKTEVDNTTRYGVSR